MNTQDIIYPIGEATEWTFENILVPMADPMNLGIVVLGFIGLVFWLRLQKKYNDKSKSDGTIA